MITLFFEHSTRTRSSFEVAAKALGADVLTFQKDASSVAKGESLEDTVRNLDAIGADALVVRHPAAGRRRHPPGGAGSAFFGGTASGSNDVSKADGQGC